jgi:hypothetical protein
MRLTPAASSPYGPEHGVRTVLYQQQVILRMPCVYLSLIYTEE